VLIPAKLNITNTSEPSSDWHRISPTFTVCAPQMETSPLPTSCLELGISLAPRGRRATFALFVWKRGTSNCLCLC
jgi:hypothetical protein